MNTDILFGANGGLSTLLVLTGEYGAPFFSFLALFVCVCRLNRGISSLGRRFSPFPTPQSPIVPCGYQVSLERRRLQGPTHQRSCLISLRHQLETCVCSHDAFSHLGRRHDRQIQDVRGASEANESEREIGGSLFVGLLYPNKAFLFSRLPGLCEPRELDLACVNPLAKHVRSSFLFF